MWTHEKFIPLINGLKNTVFLPETILQYIRQPIPHSFLVIIMGSYIMFLRQIFTKTKRFCFPYRKSVLLITAALILVTRTLCLIKGLFTHIYTQPKQY